MVDTVRDVSAVLFALEAALRSDVNTTRMNIHVMETANTNPDMAVNGWVGLYVDDVAYDPRTAGAGARNWNFTPQFRFIVQASDMNSSKAAYSKLEACIKKVVDVAFANTTLRDTVEALTSIRVSYGFRDDDPKTLHFVGALVTLVFAGRSN